MERVTSKDGTAIGRLAVYEVPYAWPYAMTDDGPLVFP